MKTLKYRLLVAVVCAFTSLFVNTGFAQNPQNATSNEVMFKPLVLPTMALESYGQKEAARLQERPTRFTAGKLKVQPKATARLSGEVKLAAHNMDQLEVSKVPAYKVNPSASAEYCVLPTANTGCCNYWIRNGVSSSNELYGAPSNIFADETSARNYYLGLRPAMAFYLPYTDSKVFPGQGWLYSSGNGHGSVDYSKSNDAYGPGIDPTFNVYASAAGKVIAADWVDLFGNYIILEHTAPNGNKYRTGYFHLRNGFDNDLAKAKAVKVTSGDPASRDSLYVLFANKSNPSKLLWGTNSQKMKVQPGDWVAAGQHIAYAGNTGFGGAGWGLDASGNPTNPHTANNHLHFMLWAESPTNSNNVSWLEVDPYGVYSKINSESTTCYEPGYNKAFHRFFAPFYPAFHNVPVEYIIKHWDYYTGMGMALQTLSVHKSGNRYLASGAFQAGLPANWYCRINMNSQQYQQYFNDYDAKGFVPRQISVTRDGNGQPLFTAIWRKRAANEAIVAYHNLDNAGWAKVWDQHVNKEKKRCAEHIAYEANGKPKHLAVFTTDNPGFYVYTGLSSAELKTRFDELNTAGFMTTSLTAEEVGGKITYGGVWEPRGNKGYYAFGEMSPHDYQLKFNKFNQQGYKLHRIMGYNNSQRFAAVWIK